jgi:hypothetical protein
MLVFYILPLLFALPSALAVPLVQAPLGSTPPALYPYPEQIIAPDAGFKFPTVRESAILARRLLALSPLGTLATTFPNQLSSPRIPSTVSNLPIGLPDYISACGKRPHESNPTLLAINIATSFRNALGGDHSNVSLSIQWESPHKDCIAANLPRMALIGYLEPITFTQGGEEKELERCFTEVHPDAKWWLPSNPASPHGSQWVRLNVQEIYWIGGFGDRNYIGWIPEETWSSVTEEEWKKARLRGEEEPNRWCRYIGTCCAF